MTPPRSTSRDGNTATLTVCVQPGASRAGIIGMRGDALKVAVTAPPEKGKANKALVKLLAGEFGLPAGNVIVASGTGARRKVVRLHGIAPGQVEATLAEKLPT